MSEIATVGLDLAKMVFQVHGADRQGGAVLRKRLRRDQVLAFFEALPGCLVAMEACGSAHYWAREISKLGHEVRLIAPVYVRPFRKRQKNDAADAEAICEAAQRPTMRFVPVKDEEQQASALIFRSRDLLMGQRTQVINAIRSHLSEFGLIIGIGPANVVKLVAQVDDPACKLPAAARPVIAMLSKRLRALEGDLSELDKEIVARARTSSLCRRLMTIPGVGTLTATAVEALAPQAATFDRGRDFAAWLGLTPLQHSTGGKPRLGRMSKMGDRTLRRLIILGSSSVVCRAVRGGAPPAGSWLARMLERKPRMIVIIAMANKIARVLWALLARGGTYQAPAVAAD